jgi:hypothetical protein
MVLTTSWYVLCALLGLGVLTLFFSARRSAHDVVFDLAPEVAESGRPGGVVAREPGGEVAWRQLGLVTPAHERRARRAERGLPIAGFVVFGVARLALGGGFGAVLISAAIGGALGVLIAGSLTRRRTARIHEEIEFHLPIVMESIVMAVEAGLDVVSALGRVLEVPRGVGDGADTPRDPVSRLLEKVLERTNGGWSFEDALKDVAHQVGNHSLRHAFIHLGLAYREGGELVAPLRELSHSTQLHFQESVEERIAKLPVKATAPLLCTFTGLIVCFITVPLMQVMHLADKATPGEFRPRIVGERGTTTLFIAFFVLPVLYFLFTLGLDLSAYSTETARRQRALDQVVLEAIRFLPDSSRARLHVEGALDRHGVSGAEIVTTTSEVGVTSRGITMLSFPQLLGVDAGVPFGLYSRARVNPVDAFVAVDLGAYLAPDVIAGDVSGEPGVWGAADYFEAFPRQVEPPLDARRLTAQCFNPALVAVKLGAIRAYDYLSGFSGNRVGLGIYPGNGYHLEAVRSLVVPEAGKFARYTNQYVRNEDCWVAAASEPWFERYRFPESRYAGGAPPNHAVMVTPAGEFDPAYGASVRPTDMVWGSVVRSPSPGSAGIANFSEVLGGLYSEIFGAPTAVMRGGLAANPRRVGLILAGDTPREGGARFPDPIVTSALDQWLARFSTTALERGAHVRLYVVTFPHPGIAGLPDVSGEFAAYAASRGVETAGGSFRLVAYGVANGGEALDDVLNHLMIDRQGGYLAR